MDLLQDGRPDIVSKRKLRRALYLTRMEYEAICDERIKQFIDLQIKNYGEIDIFKHSQLEFREHEQLDQINEEEEGETQNDQKQLIGSGFEAMIQNDDVQYGSRVGSKQGIEKDFNYNSQYNQEIEPMQRTRLESNRGQFSSYSCSYSNPDYSSGVNDDVKLTFSNFYDLMSNKIVQQKRSSSLNTVFESRTENVSCILWPSFTGTNRNQKKIEHSGLSPPHHNKEEYKIQVNGLTVNTNEEFKNDNQQYHINRFEVIDENKFRSKEQDNIQVIQRTPEQSPFKDRQSYDQNQVVDHETYLFMRQSQQQSETSQQL
ncbi:UNKNOWN [Stylonychia lemnae]|uniref:Uncharacterized protein n=1 Tax=Stylonychia lemnae TaxID=5949 RepID=A0A078AM59_STYLE|nr:UNKNOWN [Stylonychia lemnae]|eukprot:CDW82487.1 UNKNOWN [Stylonychia lemnae]